MTDAEAGGTVETATRGPGAPGRRFEGTRPVRLGDADPRGRLRLDGLARHLQDVAGDDSRDAGLGDAEFTWVMRRAAAVIERSPRYLERVTYTTFCGGTGPRWAERRTSGRGAGGARVEASALWTCVDARTGRARALPDGFERTWGATAAGRTVSARLQHPPPPDGVPEVPWQVRSTDLDVLGHVNNAVHWAAVEDELARLLPGRVPVDAECEYRVAIEVGDAVTLRSVVDRHTLRTWMVSARGLHASAVVRVDPG
jgi:acyl-ACP thioesterase